MPSITKRYPPGPITPRGSYHLLAGDKPLVAYRSWDDRVVFNLMGALAFWDPTIPESVRLIDLKGLIPPWQSIEQKGATQDGTTFVTSLYDPLEIDLTVELKGRDPAYTRELVRDWIAAWDAKKPGCLSWYTHELGYWWANVRWAKTPVDKFLGGDFTRQRFGWVARCEDAFWRSFDTTDVFAFSYLSAIDRFTVDTETDQDLGDDWTIAYTGAGTGYLYSDGTQATSTLLNGKYGVAQRTGFVTATDEQIITITIGPIDPWPAAVNTFLDIWARMPNEGVTPGQTGVRLRIGYRGHNVPGSWKRAGYTYYKPFVELAHYVDGSKTVLASKEVSVPWLPGDQISLAVGGYNGKLYSYYVQRGTNRSTKTKNVTWSNVLTVVRNAADGSSVGAGYRGAGFGMEADGVTLPPSIKCWTAGDSSAAEESGYVHLTNVGDQDMWPYYILVGPGIFAIGDGPNATQAVTYGPLETNQMVLINTDPRKYGVTDLTSMPPPGTPATSQYLSALSAAMARYNSFLSNSNFPSPALSAFGTPFPQGNPYSLLRGRFSRPIPAKQPGLVAEQVSIAVAVESGAPTTAILAGGTPLRRWPG